MSRIWVNPGVSFRNLKPQTVFAMERIREVFCDRGLHCVITECWREETPGKRDLHPPGYAVDADTDHEISPDSWGLIRHEVQTILGDEYDVVAHASPRWHLHTEYDPKRDFEKEIA